MIEKNLLIPLLLIDRHSGFKNSYALVRVMEFQFRISNFVEVFNEMVSRGFAESKLCKNQTNDFEITVKGKAYLDLHKDNLYDVLRNDYPDLTQFINDLFCRNN